MFCYWFIYFVQVFICLFIYLYVDYKPGELNLNWLSWLWSGYDEINLVLQRNGTSCFRMVILILFDFVNSEFSKSKSF